MTIHDWMRLSKPHPDSNVETGERDKDGVPSTITLKSERILKLAQALADAVVGYSSVEVNVAYGFLMSQLHRLSRDDRESKKKEGA